MHKFRSAVEKAIEEARQEGKFDNLPGHGKPLRLEENPHEAPEKRMAHHILRSNGFAPAWIEMGKAIDARYRQAVGHLDRTWSWYQRYLAQERPAPGWVHSDWQRALEAFLEEIQALNQLIRNHNVQVPNPRFERRPLDASKELARIQDA